MGQCKYCKEETGFLKSKQIECEKKHEEGCQNLTSLLLQAFRNYTDFYLLDSKIKTILSSSNISPETKRSWFANNFIININQL
jgi:hypothetical protein